MPGLAAGRGGFLDPSARRIGRRRIEFAPLARSARDGGGGSGALPPLAFGEFPPKYFQQEEGQFELNCRVLRCPGVTGWRA